MLNTLLSTTRPWFKHCIFLVLANSEELTTLGKIIKLWQDIIMTILFLQS